MFSAKTASAKSFLRVLRLALTCVFMCMWAGTENAAAQETPEKPGAQSGYFQRTADGTLIPLSEFGIQDADLEALIRQRQPREAPHYEITRVAIEGQTEGPLATLQAVIAIRINVDDRWVSVPLALDEARMTDVPAYKGPERPIFDRKRSRETGTRHWFFKGRGDHEITLPLILTVREPQHLRHAVRLKLPDAAVQTQLTLRVPGKVVLAETPKGSGSKVTSTNSGSTIDVWGLGTQFVLQWDVRPDVVGSRPFLRSGTVLTANLATDPFSIVATQTLEMQQGSVRRLDITLPQGLVPSRTEPQQIDPTGRVRKVEVFDDTGRVVVTLAEPLTDQIELNWSLVPEVTELARRWVFTGFLVDGAQEQTTELELTPPEGVAVQALRSVGIQQQRTRAGRVDQRVTRCRLLSPTSEFVVQLRDVEPFFTVTPRIAVDITQDQLRMEARFRVRVLRGSLQQLQLSWPGFEEEGWKLLPLSPGEDLTEWTSNELSGDTLNLDLLTRVSGTFEIAVGAVRLSGGAEDVPVSLPDIEAQTRQPAALVLSSETNVDVRVTGAEGTTSTPIPIDSAMTQGFELSFENRNLRALLVRSDERRFDLALRTRDRLLSATGQVVLEVGDSTLNVDQTIRYQLDFDHIAELRLAIPEEINPTVSLQDGTQLRRIAVGQSTSRYVLPRPLTGSFDISIQYRLAFESSESTLTVPLAVAADTPVTQQRVGILPGARLRVTPLGDWTPAYSRQFEAEWTTAQPVEELRLSLGSPLGVMARRFSVTRALLQTKLSGSIAETRANFLLQGRFRQQVLNVPDGISVSAVSWNGVTLPAQSWRIGQVENTRVLTIQQVQNSGSGILSIDFRTPIPASSWARQLSLASLTMPADVPVDEVIWQVIMPTGEHVSAFDPGSTPCFEWTLGSFGWRRRPLVEFRDLDQWLRKGTARQTQVVRTAVGNAYAFHQPGLRSSMRVATFDQSFVLLLGSGVAFLTAFGLIRFSPRRFALVLPVIGLAFALLSLRYAPALQLLTQPILLGVGLAMLANWVDKRRYRRGYAPYGMDQPISIAREAVSAEQTLPYPPALSGSSQ